MKKIHPFLLITIFLIANQSAMAQTPLTPLMPTDNASTDSTSGEENVKWQFFIQQLSDPEIQKRLLSVSPEVKPKIVSQDVSLQQFISDKLRDMQLEAGNLMVAFSAIPGEIERAKLLMLADSSPTQLWLTLAFIPLFFGIGWFSEELLWRLVRPLYWKVLDVPRSRPLARLSALIFRVFYAFLSVSTFALFSLGLFLTLDWPDVARIIIVTYLTIFIILRLTWRLTKIIFSPKAEQLRLLPIDNHSARFLRSWAAILAGAAAFFSTATQVLRDVGFSANTQKILTLTGGLIVLGVVIYMVLHARKLLKTYSAHINQKLLDLWPTYIIACLTFSWIILLLGSQSMSNTLIVVAFLPITLKSIEAIIATAVKTPPESADSEGKTVEQQHEEALENAKKQITISPWEAAIERSVRSLILAGAAYWIVTFWGVDIIQQALSGSTQTPVASAIFNATLTILIADFIWNLIASSIDSHLKEVPTDGEHHDMTRNEARLQTLLPILRLFLMVVVWVISGMVALSSLGFNIGPLLASAGVVGVAIAFGSQTLVRDIVSGIFFLLDDAFRVGEYIESGNIRGTVEAMSLRSLRLRHHRGPLHTVPFGDLKAITNHSRDWVIMKLEVGLVYDTDLEVLRKTVKEIGKMMMNDPEVGPNMLEPLKSQGVNRLGDFNLIVRVKFKCKPGQQFTARRLAYKLMQEIFPARGIRFAFPTITIAGEHNATQDEKAALAAQAILVKKAETPA